MKKSKQKKLPNYVVQSGELDWTGFAESDRDALAKAFESFKGEYLSTFTRFATRSGPWMYLSTEQALKLSGEPFEITY